MIPFSPPRYHPEILEELEGTLKSGWITTGPKTKLFEKQLTAYCGNKVTNALNSATAGMEMVLRWFGVGEGDEVIIPAYTYCATANVVVHLGAKPVMVDVGDDFNISVTNIEAAITNKTKVIVPVDFGGWPCDYDEIMGLAVKHQSKFTPNSDQQKLLNRILVMADAAHSFGASYKGKKSGSLADVSVFSFHAVKNLSTAEGGCICWNLPESFNHEDIYVSINTLVLHGQSKDALAKTQLGGWRYDVDEPGYKCNMTDIHACLGLVGLKYYAETLARRQFIVETYDQAFENESWAKLRRNKTTDKETSYHLYALRVPDMTEDQRDTVITKVAEKGVSVNVHFIPLPLLSAYEKRNYNIEHYPTAHSLFKTEISLPVYYDLSDEDIQTVIESIKSSVKAVLNA